MWCILLPEKKCFPKHFSVLVEDICTHHLPWQVLYVLEYVVHDNTASFFYIMGVKIRVRVCVRVRIRVRLRVRFRVIFRFRVIGLGLD